MAHITEEDRALATVSNKPSAKIDLDRVPDCPVCQMKAAWEQIDFSIKRRHGCEIKTELKFFCCNVWAWGYRPMVDMETHEARKRAHAAFDQIWQILGLVGRSEAYRRLSVKMGISRHSCHMSRMDIAQCADVVVHSYEIIHDLAREGVDKGGPNRRARAGPAEYIPGARELY